MLEFIIGQSQSSSGRVLYVRVGAGVGHGEDTGASVLQGEVLIAELLAVDGLATSALETFTSVSSRSFPWGEGGARSKLTLRLVKSPPWSMNWGMTRWKIEPL